MSQRCDNPEKDVKNINKFHSLCSEMSNCRDGIHRRYEVARLHAEATALRYENNMLKGLIADLLQKVRLGDRGEDEPEETEDALVFNRRDLDKMNDADEFYGGEDGEAKEDGGDYWYYDDEGRYHEYSAEDPGDWSEGGEEYEDDQDFYDETAEQGEDVDLNTQDLDDQFVIQSFNAAVAGNFEDEHSSDCSTEEDDNFTRSKKATKTQEKIEPNVDYKRQAEAMRELYGERADEIYSMEAKLQYEFDRFCSKERPVLWPCLPINMKFD